jgi:hypothetical protein
MLASGVVEFQATVRQRGFVQRRLISKRKSERDAVAVVLRSIVFVWGGHRRKGASVLDGRRKE